MSDSANWSTNEIEDRYSAELLEAVRYLLTTDDPYSEGEYYSGLHQMMAAGEDGNEPGETLVICRSNAYGVLENVITRTEPFIEEDILFVEIEMKIQDKANANDTQIGREAPLMAAGGGW